jgi:putative ABC transport system ATP-binding protein
MSAAPHHNAVDPILDARGLWRVFAEEGARSEVVAVRDVSLTLERGEFVALAGPSGSGKSTLLHLLAGIDRPTRGTVTFLNYPMSAMAPDERARLRLQYAGILLAEHNLSPVLTARENIEWPLALRGIDRTACARRSREAMATLQISALSESFPRALSSGERQRVALARAIAGEAICIFADEPTSHLASAQGAALLDALNEAVTKRGVAAVIATHDPVVMERASRVVFLRDGAVEAA